MTAPLVAARAATAGRTVAAGGAARVAGTRPLPTRTNGRVAQLATGRTGSAPGRTEPLPDNRNGTVPTRAGNGARTSSTGGKPTRPKTPSKPTVGTPKAGPVKMPKVGTTKLPKVHYSHSGAVKGEFLLGFALFLLAPLGNPEIKMDKGFVRRLVAFCLLFMMLFPLANSSNSSAARIAPMFGGVVLLYLAVLAPSRGFIVNASDLMEKIVRKLQPH